MENSILNTVKKSLPIDISVDAFDSDILMHINSVLIGVTQMGVGPDTGLRVEDATTTWGDLLDTITNLEAIKSYICLRVKLLFDPPSNSYLIDAIEKQCDELAWRVTLNADNNAAEPIII